MALSKQGGDINSSDVRGQVPSAGTVTGRQVARRGISAHKITSVVDDTSPLITYGLLNGTGTVTTWSTISSDVYSFGGTGTVIGGLYQTGTEYEAAQYHFQGSSIGVFARTNPWSGDMWVYIDGALTEGRTILTITPNPGNINAPAIFATDTVITPSNVASAALAAFPTSGKLQIGDERLTYSAISGGAFTGLVRGVDGTTASNHYSNETIYLVNSGVGLYSATDWGTRRLAWYTNMLPAGPHTITIVARRNATSGMARIFFDGFLDGSIIGSRNVFTQFYTINFSFTTTANGHAELGELTAYSNDISLISIVGYTDPLCEADNTRILGKLGLRYSNTYDLVHDGAPDGEPRLYYHNGPPSTAVTLVVTFAYLGESV